MISALPHSRKKDSKGGALAWGMQGAVGEAPCCSPQRREEQRKKEIKPMRSIE